MTPDELDLVTAFREIGSCSIPPARIRNLAAVRIVAELEVIAPQVQARLRAPPDQRDDAVQIVGANLARTGPRGERPGDPDTDARVRAYLWTCVKNAILDLMKAHGPGSNPPPGDIPDPTPPVSGEPTFDWDVVRDRLYRDLLPLIAPRPGPPRPDAFLKLIGDLRRVCRDRGLIDAEIDSGILASMTEPTEADRKRERNRLERAFSRARFKLLDGLRDLHATGRLQRAEYEALIYIFQQDLCLNAPRKR